MNKSRGPRNQHGTGRMMRKPAWLLQFFLPRVDWKQVGYESLEIQAETFALEAPTDHSTVGLGSGVRSIPEE